MFSKNNVTQLKIPRSYKKISPIFTTTFNTGDCVPVFHMEVIPNDKISLGYSAVTNMITPNFATMDTLYQNIAFFFCPNRLVWEGWDKFYGEGKNADYETFIQKYIPQLSCPNGGWAEHTIADYLGVTTKKNCHSVSALPFRMFALIYNEYYRDEQRMAKALVSKGDADQTGSNGNDYVNDLQNGGKVPKACKLYDYFTGTKLEFQAGDPVMIPVGQSAPVNLYATPSDSASGYSDLYLKSQATNGSTTAIKPFLYSPNDAGATPTRWLIAPYEHNEQDGAYAYRYQGGISATADLTQAEGISIRDFKRLLMLQQELQNIEDGGSRYIEQLWKRWGVYANELEIEIPQFLGARTTILNMAMVVGTSGKATGMTDYEFGQLTGMSNTYDKGHVFTKHFKQHGYIFGIVTIRPYNTYENGIPKDLVKRTIDDFYKPEMAYFGPDIVRNYEIYSDSTDNKDDDMFGVRNYGDELRYIPNRVTGQMRTNATNSQAYKTYSINYASRPVNNQDFILQNASQVDKTLTETSSDIDQFTFQIQVDISMVRNLPKNPQAEQLIRL